MSMRSVLITGCSSGIGYACALGLRERGYRVFASARAASDVDMLSALGLEALQLDVADSASIDEAVERVLASSAVLEKLVHALEHPRSKARYYVTLPTHVLGALKRVLSSAMMDRVLLAVSRKELK